jgi:hypothetical protein
MQTKQPLALPYTLASRMMAAPKTKKQEISPTFCDIAVRLMARELESPATKSVLVRFEPEVPWHSYKLKSTQYSSDSKVAGSP